MLRFCMITTFYPPYHFGGDAIHIYRLSNALARRGHKVDVICDADAYHLLHPSAPPGDFPNEPGVTLHVLRSPFNFLSPLATQQLGHPFFKRKKIQAVLDANPPDVINYHNVSLVGGPGVLFMGKGVKLYTTHEHWLVCPMHVLWKYHREACDTRECWSCQIQGKRPPQLWRHTGLLGRAMKEIDLFISPSEWTLKRHTDWGGLDIPMTRLSYYYSPPENEAEALADATPAHTRPYFLMVGRLEKIKGFHNVIPAFDKYPDADLLIAGEGDYGAALRELGKGRERVKFLGRKSQAELIRLYSQAIALIVPSICYEVYGIIIIESMARRTPVIANHFGVLPEVIERSRGGLTYRDEAELVEAMRRMQTDKAERDLRGEQGHQAYLEHWTEEAHLRRYLGIVEELMAKKGLAPRAGEGSAA